MRIQEELSLLERGTDAAGPVSPRTPSYCAGCPHRGTSSVIMDLRARLSDPGYMRREHGREPVDIVSHGGIGCYSLNFLPPFRDMHNMAAMGLGGAAGMGAYPFTRNKHYVLCGDSTFFHSEMSTLSNAIKDNQDILYIILDNKNTAMTGHQVTAGSAYDIMGYRTIQQDIESVVRGMDTNGRLFIRRIDPSHRDSYMDLLEDAFLMDGVRVIIADRECGITYHRRKRADMRTLASAQGGFLRVEKHINITPEVCENCRACTQATGCPGLTITDTAYGEKIAIDRNICVDDKYCTKIKACPSFEQVVITRKRPAPKKTGNWDLWMRDIPAPRVPRPGVDGGNVFSVFVPGVGGMGLGFIARILTEAGSREGYAVNYYHQKGLAQRNGAVVSHVLYSIPGTRLSQRIPDGKADLILGLDFLETVRGLSFASAGRTAVVCNTARTPTILMLTGEDRFPEDLEGRIAARAREGAFLAADFFELAEHYLGDRIYANLMMLGAAGQSGLLPLHPETVEDVIRDSVRQSEREANLRAFRIGRRLVSHPEMLQLGRREDSCDDVVRARATAIARGSRRRAAAFEAGVRSALDAMSPLPDQLRREFARRYADLTSYGNSALADAYAARVLEVFAVETRDGSSGFEATKAVIWNLYKVTAIKDEIWVAHLLTSDEKLAGDRERYDVDPARGDRIRYVHFNRPQFELFGRTLEWDMKSRNWMLHAMKRMKFLRRLLPRWHARERAFRDWYRDRVVGAFLSGAFRGRDDALAALNLPASCTGYRDVVYPKHERAYAEFERLLSS